ncbi:hypothetical protein KIW84_041498 [Lathyrus oleraceus]|uniref:Uncharacterized protein n=1 Tax=Pisum sativum TaxID=3888 RepID=A0A9D4XD21_PEA|nr:hypothetical protein KIW84_041498 [Pisum sativum]
MSKNYEFIYHSLFRCLGKVPRGWQLDFLEVSQMEFVQSSCKTIEVQKKLHAKIKIVKTDSLPLIELGKMKSYILNSKSQRIRDGLLEVAVVLYHAEIVFKCSGLLMLLKLDVCPVFLLRHCNLWGCYLLPAADTCLLQLLNNRRFGIAEAGIGGVHRALLSELTGLQLSSIDEPQTSAVLDPV